MSKARLNNDREWPNVVKSMNSRMRALFPSRAMHVPCYQQLPQRRSASFQAIWRTDVSFVRGTRRTLCCPVFAFCFQPDLHHFATVGYNAALFPYEYAEADWLRSLLAFQVAPVCLSSSLPQPHVTHICLVVMSLWQH
jgi:hypothetical protein